LGPSLDSTLTLGRFQCNEGLGSAKLGLRIFRPSGDLEAPKGLTSEVLRFYSEFFCLKRTEKPIGSCE
jgi:hypothetical protein